MDKLFRIKGLEWGEWNGRHMEAVSPIGLFSIDSDANSVLHFGVKGHSDTMCKTLQVAIDNCNEWNETAMSAGLVEHVCERIRIHISPGADRWETQCGKMANKTYHPASKHCQFCGGRIVEAGDE